MFMWSSAAVPDSCTFILKYLEDVHPNLLRKVIRPDLVFSSPEHADQTHGRIFEMHLGLLNRAIVIFIIIEATSCLFGK